MADSQGDVYVRRDVFEARMDRMEMLLEKTVLEIKSYVDKSTGETKTYVERSTADTRAYVEKSTDEMKSEIVALRNDVRVLTTRVDSLENVFYWGLSGFGIILASAVILPAIMGFLKNLFKPPFTLEDMEQIAERVANTVIERHLSGGK